LVKEIFNIVIIHLKIKRARQVAAHLPINKVSPRVLQYVELRMGATPMELLQG